MEDSEKRFEIPIEIVDKIDDSQSVTKKLEEDERRINKWSNFNFLEGLEEDSGSEYESDQLGFFNDILNQFNSFFDIQISLLPEDNSLKTANEIICNCGCPFLEIIKIEIKEQKIVFNCTACNQKHEMLLFKTK
jgi:hypothetical protein